MAAGSPQNEFGIVLRVLEEYGRRVGELLLGLPKVRSFYGKALATATERDVPLHFRLVVDPRAPLRYHSGR